jgi:hypothetical protein
MVLAAVPVSLLLLVHPSTVQAHASVHAVVRATVGVAHESGPAGAADVPSNDGDADDTAVTTSTIVASESPNPGLGQGAPAPEIGPIVVPADTSSFSRAWWLVAFGGVQLVGLFFITRRARTRLSTRSARS